MYYFFLASVIMICGLFLLGIKFISSEPNTICGESSFIKTGFATLQEPLKEIYNLDTNQSLQFVVGLHILSSLSFEQKKLLLGDQLIDSLSHVNKIRIIYDIYSENGVLGGMMTNPFTREQEIILRGTKSLQALIRLIKNPPSGLTLNKAGNEISSAIRKKCIDTNNDLDLVLSNKMNILDFVIAAIPRIYLGKKEDNLQNLRVFIENEIKSYESQYDDKLVNAIEEKIEKENLRLLTEFEKNFLELRGDAIEKRKNDIITNLAPEAFNKALHSLFGGEVS